MSDLSDGFEDFKETLAESIDDLRKKREELAVQIKLGSMEARDEWEELEQKMHELEGKWHQFQMEAGLEDTAKSIGTAMQLLGSELKSGYERIKSAL